MDTNHVAYYYHPNFGNYYYGNGHPMKPQRLRLTHSLIQEYGLLQKLQFYEPKALSRDALTEFHTPDYVDFLRSIDFDPDFLPFIPNSPLNSLSTTTSTPSSSSITATSIQSSPSTFSDYFEAIRSPYVDVCDAGNFPTNILAKQDSITVNGHSNFTPISSPSSPHSSPVVSLSSRTRSGSKINSETAQDTSFENTYKLWRKYNVGEDCPLFPSLYDFCTLYSSASLGGAKKLNHGAADYAINWSGGLHHAKKAQSSGFCYINDAVLAIIELLKYHNRVLYLDIDVHHGDGVEEAFLTTDRVLTVSFHKFGDFFFPGTGDIKSIGAEQGKYYAINVPLSDGIDDITYHSIFIPIMNRVMEWYRPGVIVLQCGADSLSGDRIGSFNLTVKGHGDCVGFMKSFGVPILALGGGGYKVENVARCWAYETSILLDVPISDVLPLQSSHPLHYYYEYNRSLFYNSERMENQNTKRNLEQLKIQIFDNLRHLPFAPSIQMVDVPRDFDVEEKNKCEEDSELSLDDYPSEITHLCVEEF